MNERHPTLTEHEFNRIALAAVFYACGRRSYMPSVVQSTLRPHLSALDDETKEIICWHISERDEQDRLGDDFDRDGWLIFADKVKESEYQSCNEVEISTVEDFWCLIMSALRYDKRCTGMPFAAACLYEMVMRKNEEFLNPKWTYNFVRDLSECYLLAWPKEYGPLTDPWGYANLYAYAKNAYEKIRKQPLPQELLVPDKILYQHCH